MSFSEKATTEELWALIDAGVEAVSCTHMGDRDMVRQFSPTLDRWLDWHTVGHCPRCDLDLVLWGETFYDSITLEHYNVHTIVRRYTP